jgi:hypothetical protein
VPIAGVAKVIFEEYKNRKNTETQKQPSIKEKSKKAETKILTTEEK